MAKDVRSSDFEPEEANMAVGVPSGRTDVARAGLELGDCPGGATAVSSATSLAGEAREASRLSSVTCVDCELSSLKGAALIETAAVSLLVG